MENTVKERLKLYLSLKKISQRHFENSVSLSNGYVNNIRKSIQPEKIQRISLCYPDLNVTWLLTGEGDMLNSPNTVLRDLPLIPIYNMQDCLNEEEDKKVGTLDLFSQFSDVDGAFSMLGDTMSPEIGAGDIVLYNKIQECNNLTIGGLYLLSLEREEKQIITILRKIRGFSEIEGFDAVVLGVENEKYSDEIIKRSSIKKVAQIKATLRFY